MLIVKLIPKWNPQNEKSHQRYVSTEVERAKAWPRAWLVKRQPYTRKDSEPYPVLYSCLEVVRLIASRYQFVIIPFRYMQVRNSIRQHIVTFMLKVLKHKYFKRASGPIKKLFLWVFEVGEKNMILILLLLCEYNIYL